MPRAAEQVFHRLRTLRPAHSTLVLGGVVAALVVSTHWLKFNVSPSVPMGLYRLTALPQPLARGTLVLLPIPPEMRYWHQAWWIELLKPVAAVAGDTVCVQEHELWIEGHSLGPLLETVAGRVLPQVVGCFTVMEGDVFLASEEPRSMDSRYFSSVQIRSLTAQAVPVWTWR